MSGFGRKGTRRGAAGVERPRKVHADPEAVAREVCLRALTMSPKTRSQLAEALQRNDIPDAVAEGVLARFSEVGLIDDEAFAQAWVRSRHAGKGHAPRRLSAELKQRGVDDETIKEAVAELQPEEIEASARALVESKLRSSRSLEPSKRVNRLVGQLARKGYAPGLAYRVVKEVLAAEGTELEDDHPVED